SSTYVCTRQPTGHEPSAAKDLYGPTTCLSAGRGDDDVAGRVLAFRAGGHSVHVLQRVVHHLAVGRGHRLQGPLGAGLHHLGGDLLAEPLEGGRPLLPVAGDVDQDPVRLARELPLHHRTGDVLEGREGGPLRTHQDAEAVTGGGDLDGVVVEHPGLHGGLQSVTDQQALQEPLGHFRLLLEGHAFSHVGFLLRHRIHRGRRTSCDFALSAVRAGSVGRRYGPTTSTGSLRRSPAATASGRPTGAATRPGRPRLPATLTPGVLTSGPITPGTLTGTVVLGRFGGGPVSAVSVRRRRPAPAAIVLGSLPAPAATSTAAPTTAATLITVATLAVPRPPGPLGSGADRLHPRPYP